MPSVSENKNEAMSTTCNLLSGFQYSYILHNCDIRPKKASGLLTLLQMEQIIDDKLGCNRTISEINYNLQVKGLYMQV